MRRSASGDMGFRDKDMRLAAYLPKREWRRLRSITLRVEGIDNHRGSCSHAQRFCARTLGGAKEEVGVQAKKRSASGDMGSRTRMMHCRWTYQIVCMTLVASSKRVRVVHEELGV